MAVKQDTRQRLLFANDELQVDAENPPQSQIWKRTASRRLGQLLYRTKISTQTGWHKKSESVFCGIRKRSKDVKKNSVQTKKGITWNVSATLMFTRLKVKTRQFSWHGWIRKSASTAMGQNKRARRATDT